MSLQPPGWDAHPTVRTDGELTRGERAADVIRNAMGSWRFIIWQSAVVAVWMGLNSAAWVLRWDPYPWILLNLAFSTQAAYASPIILLAGRRSDQRAAEVAMHDLATDQATLATVTAIGQKLDRLIEQRTAGGGA